MIVSTVGMTVVVGVTGGATMAGTAATGGGVGIAVSAATPGSEYHI